MEVPQYLMIDKIGHHIVIIATATTLVALHTVLVACRGRALVAALLTLSTLYSSALLIDCIQEFPGLPGPNLMTDIVLRIISFEGLGILFLMLLGLRMLRKTIRVDDEDNIGV